MNEDYWLPRAVQKEYTNTYGGWTSEGGVRFQSISSINHGNWNGVSPFPAGEPKSGKAHLNLTIRAVMKWYGNEIEDP